VVGPPKDHLETRCGAGHMPRVELAKGHSVATLQAHTKSAAPRASDLQIERSKLPYVDNSSLYVPL